MVQLGPPQQNFQIQLYAWDIHGGNSGSSEMLYRTSPAAEYVNGLLLRKIAIFIPPILQMLADDLFLFIGRKKYLQLIKAQQALEAYVLAVIFLPCQAIV